jgi:hypothetical protein
MSGEPLFDGPFVVAGPIGNTGGRQGRETNQWTQRMPAADREKPTRKKTLPAEPDEIVETLANMGYDSHPGSRSTRDHPQFPRTRHIFKKIAESCAGNTGGLGIDCRRVGYHRNALRNAADLQPRIFFGRSVAGGAAAAERRGPKSRLNKFQPIGSVGQAKFIGPGFVGGELRLLSLRWSRKPER